MHPNLVQFDHLVVPTYGVVLALGIVASLLVLLRIARLLSLNTDKVWNLALIAILTVIAGTRLLLVSMNWREFGMSAFAASLTAAEGFGVFLDATGIAIALCLLYARRVHLPLRRTADAFAPAVALFASVASIGCLEAGCGYGTPSRLPWAIIFNSTFTPVDTPLGVPLHPTQIYTSMADFALFAGLLWLLRHSHHDGEIAGSGLFLGGLCDFFLTFLRGDAGTEYLLQGRFSVEQLVAAVMVLSGGALWLRRGSDAKGHYAG